MNKSKNEIESFLISSRSGRQIYQNIVFLIYSKQKFSLKKKIMHFANKGGKEKPAFYGAHSNYLKKVLLDRIQAWCLGAPRAPLRGLEGQLFGN